MTHRNETIETLLSAPHLCSRCQKPRHWHEMNVVGSELLCRRCLAKTVPPSARQTFRLRLRWTTWAALVVIAGLIAGLAILPGSVVG